MVSQIENATPTRPRSGEQPSRLEACGTGVRDSRPDVPPPQHNLQTATDKAFEDLREQSREQMGWLGAAAVGDVWRIPIFNAHFDVDLVRATVRGPDGKDVSPWWRILALHYLAIQSRPAAGPPEVVFAGLPGGRVYASVYEGRVIKRLCATAGRELPRLRAAAQSIGGIPVDGGDAAFDIGVFPRVSTRLIWHAGDEEFPPTATLLLPANIESFLCIEDIVVLSECLVSRLCGRPF